MIRLLFYFFLFYFIYQVVKSVVKFLFQPTNTVKGTPKKDNLRHFNSDEIEDVDYEEVDKKHGKSSN